MCLVSCSYSSFFFDGTAPSEIYTLSLHDALPISAEDAALACDHGVDGVYVSNHGGRQLDHGRGTMDILPEVGEDRKSTRLNSSHQIISYAVFCLKKKKK